MPYLNTIVGKKIDKLYPDYAVALNAADIVQDKFPKLGEVWKNKKYNIEKEGKMETERQQKCILCLGIQ
eukprot:5310061-Ditylum_brightwellii.AAC.1